MTTSRADERARTSVSRTLSPDAFAAPYEDPIHDGPTDPVVVFDAVSGEHVLFYTQRRTHDERRGVEWVHGTAIASARSRDGGVTWAYTGVVSGLQPGGLAHPLTLWAPDVVLIDGVWVMFLTVVEGVHDDWVGTAAVHQFESADLTHWVWTGRARLGHDAPGVDAAAERVIDAAVARTADGRYRLWYKDEHRGSTTFVAVSDDPRDASAWRVEGRAVGGRAHEGPKVFDLGGWWWMIVDEWRGLAVHRSPDGIGGWARQEHRGGLIADAVAAPGGGTTVAHHADVVPLAGGDDDARALLVYFAHPVAQHGIAGRRSHVAAAVLTVRNGVLTCSDGPRP